MPAAVRARTVHTQHHAPSASRAAAREAAPAAATAQPPNRWHLRQTAVLFMLQGVRRPTGPGSFSLGIQLPMAMSPRPVAPHSSRLRSSGTRARFSTCRKSMYRKYAVIRSNTANMAIPDRSTIRSDAAPNSRHRRQVPSMSGPKNSMKPGKTSVSYLLPQRSSSPAELKWAGMVSGRKGSAASTRISVRRISRTQAVYIFFSVLFMIRASSQATKWPRPAPSGPTRRR